MRRQSYITLLFDTLQIAERKRAALRKRDECVARLRDVGALPAAELAALAGGKRKRDLMASLSKVNEELLGFAHVNKKAMEQHSHFADEKEALVARKEELDRSDASIHDLIDTLDARKDEAIERTFRGVAKHFAAVFAELVPKGSASMSIVTADELEEGDGAPPARKRKSKGAKVETFVGLGVSATFTDAGEMATSSAFSGGQKTLLGLALILAIQREDPAPFYIFDEVDSALDAVYRSSLAKLIASSAHGDDGVQVRSAAVTLCIEEGCTDRTSRCPPPPPPPPPPSTDHRDDIQARARRRCGQHRRHLDGQQGVDGFRDDDRGRAPVHLTRAAGGNRRRRRER